MRSKLRTILSTPNHTLMNNEWTRTIQPSLIPYAYRVAYHMCLTQNNYFFIFKGTANRKQNFLKNNLESFLLFHLKLFFFSLLFLDKLGHDLVFTTNKWKWYDWLPYTNQVVEIMNKLFSIKFQHSVYSTFDLIIRYHYQWANFI